MTADLEFLRAAFKDDRLHFGVGTIEQIELSTDFTTLYCLVTLLPEERQIVAKMSWSDVNWVSFPELKDLVTVGFIDGHPDEAYILSYISTSEEPIPVLARSGGTVINSRVDQPLFIGSDTYIGLARPDVVPLEPMVLGTTLVAGLTTLLGVLVANAATFGTDSITNAPIILNPAIASALSSFISTYLTNPATNILSQIAFTERGV